MMSAVFDEKHDRSESEGRDDSDSDTSDDATIASYDSDFPDEYIIHDHEARLNGKYSHNALFHRTWVNRN